MTFKKFIEKTNEFDPETKVQLHTPGEYGVPVTLMQANKVCNGGFVCFTYSEDHLPRTLGYVRTIFQEYPEMSDYILTVYVPEFGSNQNNIVRYLSWNKDKSVLAVNDKRGEDVREELRARAEHYIEENYADADALQDAFDSGFTLLDFQKAGSDMYDWAVKTKEEFGCMELQERLSGKVA